MKRKSLVGGSLALFGLTTLIASAETYSVQSSSYLGGPGEDELTSTAIQSDGTLILAGNLSRSDYGGVSPTYLDGADAGSVATLVRLSTDGQTVLSVTKLTADMELRDLALDSLDNVYVTLERKGDTHATGAGKVLKLNPAAGAILFRNEDAQWLQVDAGEQGFFAVVGDPGRDFGQPHRVRLYDPAGNLMFEKVYPERGLRDVAVSEEHRMLIVTGFGIEWLGIGEYHLPFLMGFGFNGALRYTGYDPMLKDRIPINPWNMVRPYSASIGQDGELYMFSGYTGQPHDNPLFFDPFAVGMRRNPVGGDRYHTASELAYQDTRRKFAFGRYGVNEGTLDRWQVFASIMGGSGSNAFFDKPGQQAVGPDGRLYFAGTTAAGFPIPPEVGCGSDMQCFNATGDGYTGGANLFFMSADMGKRLYAAKIGDGWYNGIDVRRLNGEEVIVAAGGTSGSTGHYIHNALQPVKGDASEGYFAILNTPGPAVAPAAPSDLELVSSTAAGNVLRWNSHTENEDGFMVERSVDGGSFKPVARVFPGRTSFRDMHLDDSSKYAYRVAAFNLAGLSGYTEIVASGALSPEPPEAPTALIARALNSTQVRLSWRPVDGTVTGYLIEGRSEKETTYQALADISPDAEDLILTGLRPGMPYGFRIRSYNDDGLSPFSPPATVVTAGLDLEPSADPENVEAGLCYGLYRRTGNFSIWGDFADPVEMVHERDGKAANMDPAKQAVPEFEITEGHFGFLYSGYIEVPEDGVYRFEYLANKHGMLFINDRVVIDNSTWKWGAWPERGAIGLEAGKHRFVCQFIHGYPRGQSPVLELRISGPGILWQRVPDEMFFRPVDCAPVYGPPPDAPRNPTATELAGNVVRVEWDGDPGMEGLHALEITPVGWSTYDRFKEVQRIPAEQTSYVLINIEPGTLYEFRVRSLNAAGYSDYSPVGSFMTDSPATLLPAPADRLEASLVSATEIGLRWRDNASDEAFFIVEKKRGDDEFGAVRTIGRNTTNLFMQDLEAGEDYTFRIGAANNAGILDYSNELQVRTLEDGLPVPAVRASRSAQGGGLVLSLQTREGVTYQVQRSEGLKADGWLNWGEAWTGNGSDWHLEVEGPSGVPVFYRIDVTEPE